jgi:hypothetical protein
VKLVLTKLVPAKAGSGEQGMEKILKMTHEVHEVKKVVLIA